MPSPSNAPRRGSREKEEEYAVFMHPIPHNFRWQEIKDIARTYCAAPVRQADTVEPSHDLGYVLIAGLCSALKAYQGFCENGIAGRKVRVSLNGPYSSRKNFTNAINHGQADKLICNNLAEYNQHQSQFQTVDLVTRSGTRQSGRSTSAILGNYNSNHNFPQNVQFAYPSTMYSTAAPTQLVATHNQHTGVHSQPQSSVYTSSAAVNGNNTPTQISKEANQQNGNLRGCSPQQQSRSRNGGRTPRGVRIVNLPGDVSKGELNKFLKRKTGGSVEPDATRIGRNGKYAAAQTVFKKASCAGLAVGEIKAFGRRPVRVEFDEEYEFCAPPRGDDSVTPSSRGENSRPLLRPRVAVAEVEADGPVVVDGAKGSRHKRPTTGSESEVDESSSDE
ncbi:hypothetical protein DV736_g3144, partial [Chaetothyriales sp. CBS 134916]